MSTNERKDKTGRIQEVELNLHDNEKQALAECRTAVAGTEVDDLRDATLARFLRNNGWQVQPAIKQMKEYLQWRKDNNIDTVLDRPNWDNKERIRHIIPYAYHGFDREGRPIYIEKTGRINAAALGDEKICPPVDMNMSHIYGVERMQQAMYEKSLETGQRVNGICTILDMEGLNFGHRQCLHVLKSALDFDRKYYPEYLGKLYVINTPWVAPYLYHAVQVFVDEVIKQRVQVVSGNPSEFLLQHIAPEYLPVEYGGSCTGEKCQQGQTGVPGCKGCIDVLDSTSLKAIEVEGLETQPVSYDFEKTLAAGDLGERAVFTWYFEVADGYDIDFSVELLRADGKKESDPNKKHYLQRPQRLKVSKGSYKAPFAGAQLLFRWDNNFSYFASKTVKYTIAVMPDDGQMGKMASVLALDASSSSSGPATAVAAAPAAASSSAAAASS